jgi:hypothetical protein
MAVNFLQCVPALSLAASEFRKKSFLAGGSDGLPCRESLPDEAPHALLLAECRFTLVRVPAHANFVAFFGAVVCDRPMDATLKERRYRWISGPPRVRLVRLRGAKKGADASGDVRARECGEL